MLYGGTDNSSNLPLSSNDNGLVGTKDYSSPNEWLLDSQLEAIMLVSTVLNSMAAGIMMIFLNTIMPALAQMDADVAIPTMNTINLIIVNPLFLIAFFGGLISAYPTNFMWKHPEEYSKPA